MQILNPSKKLQKDHAKKLSTKKWQKNGFLTFGVTVLKSFYPITFFG
jgi:hypothetical protein